MIKKCRLTTLVLAASLAACGGSGTTTAQSGISPGLSPAALLDHEHVLHAFSFTRAVEAWRADYLHSYFFYEQSLFTWVASSLLGLPRGVSCYADHVLDDYALKAIRLQLADAAVVVATSRRIRDELNHLHGTPLLLQTLQYGAARAAHHHVFFNGHQ